MEEDFYFRLQQLETSINQEVLRGLEKEMAEVYYI